MTSFLKNYRKKTLITVTIILSVMFAFINLVFFILNNAYLENEIEKENEAFVTLTTHLLNENDYSVAIEYVEHYSHTHLVEIEFIHDDNLLFKSDSELVSPKVFTLNSNIGIYYLHIDNSQSKTALLNFDYLIYINVSIIIIYFLSIIIIYRFTSSQVLRISHDIEIILKQINHKGYYESVEFNFDEFNNISNELTDSLKQIDFLREQKNIKLKGLVHDLKTPLTVVYSYLDKYKSKKTLSDEEINIAIESTKKINDLVSDVIQENFENYLVDINLSNLLEGIISQNVSVFESKNIEVIRDIEKDIIYKWNKRDFDRVINNVLANAYYYSFDSSSIEITLKKETDIEVTIKNHGIKISDEDLENIFEKNYRATQAKEVNKRGQGLGLYIVKLLLDNIEGDITAISTDLEETIFKIKLK